MGRVQLWVAALLFVAASAATAGVTERVSLSSEGTEPDDASLLASVSADGRFVAFVSRGSNLVPNDTNEAPDVFLCDRQEGSIECVSVTASGIPGNGWSYVPSISADGRYVAFRSSASDLVIGDNNGVEDVFVWDRESGVTTRVSVSTTSAGGNERSETPVVSADGRFIAFTSLASNLVPNDTNGTYDIFVRDMEEETTERVSVSTAGGQSNATSSSASITADGRFVAFASQATNLVPGDTNGKIDGFVHDRLTGGTERITISSDGLQANGDGGPKRHCISSDGRYLAFLSLASNLVPGDTNGAQDIFVRDREDRETYRASVSSTGLEANWDCYNCALSANGRYVVFQSYATNVIALDTNMSLDIFIHDLETGLTQCVSRNTDGEQGDGNSELPSISSDGRFVAFDSFSENLVSADMNEAADVFLRDRQTFGDVPIDFWAFYEIDACVDADVVFGYDGGLYHPDYPVTRDQMAVYIARGIAGGDQQVPTGPATSSFWDVATDHWAFDHIEFAVDQNVVQGYPEGDYRPDLEVTRDQMAVFVARAMVAPSGEAAIVDYVPADPRDFPDVPDDHWAYTHVEYCVEHGVVQGYHDGFYHPQYVVTRDQMAVYIARAFGLL